MFCPGCGTEERLRSQFCRACGTDLRAARSGLEHPGSIAEASLTAREEIGRSVALKIREVQSGKDLQQIAERILPQITEFLQTPAEIRLRKVRAGLVSASIGISVAIVFLVVAMVTGDDGFMIGSVLGLVPFFIGISIMLNGLYFTIPKHSDEMGPGQIPELNLVPDQLATTIRELSSANPTPTSVSITEHTTHHLSGSGL